MRVMRGIAGNFPTNVNKVSKEEIQVNVYGLNRPRNNPHYPQPSVGTKGFKNRLRVLPALSMMGVIRTPRKR